MDVNEDIYSRSLGKALTSGYILDTKKAVGTFTVNKIGATFFRGTKPIYQVVVNSKKLSKV